MIHKYPILLLLGCISATGSFTFGAAGGNPHEVPKKAEMIPTESGLEEQESEVVSRSMGEWMRRLEQQFLERQRHLDSMRRRAGQALSYEWEPPAGFKSDQEKE